MFCFPCPEMGCCGMFAKPNLRLPNLIGLFCINVFRLIVCAFPAARGFTLLPCFGALTRCSFFFHHLLDGFPLCFVFNLRASFFVCYFFVLCSAKGCKIYLFHLSFHLSPTELARFASQLLTLFAPLLPYHPRGSFGFLQPKQSELNIISAKKFIAIILRPPPFG